jgi:hypothetical protein
MEEKMHRMARNAGEIGLFVRLVTVVMGIWACLWLPPY